MFGRRSWTFFIPKLKIKNLAVAFLCFVSVYLIYYSYPPPFCDLNSESSSDKSGEITLDLEKESLDSVEERFTNLVDIGGFYSPSKCKARHRVCVVVAYRDRAEHLPIFLKNIHPFLKAQNIEYRIIVVEQIPGRLLNRGYLFNIGFVEGYKMTPFDYVAFHDVDLIPTNTRNIYICPKEHPRHLGWCQDKFNYRLIYESYFGGVSLFTTEQFKRTNGYSNRFWGWGGEDNDSFNRITKFNYTLVRYPLEIAKYHDLDHEPSIHNPNWEDDVADGPNHFETSGLNSLRYRIEKFEEKRTHTWILVDLLPDNEENNNQK